MGNKFNDLFNASDEAVAEGKKGLTKNKVERGFNAAIDSLEGEKLSKLETIDKLERAIANGEVSADNFRSLTDAVLTIEDCDEAIEVLKGKQGEFFGK
jgi:hypothetical protein